MLYLPLTPTLFDELLAMGYTTSKATQEYYDNLLLGVEGKVVYFLKSGKIGIRQRDSITTFEYQITLEQAQTIKILLTLGFTMQDAYKQVSMENLIDGMHKVHPQ